MTWEKTITRYVGSRPVAPKERRSNTTRAVKETIKRNVHKTRTDIPFDILRNSAQLKKLIKDRIKELNIDLKKLTIRVEVPEYGLYNWLNDQAVGKWITQGKIVTICGELGITLKMTLVVNEDYIVDKLLQV